MSQDKAKKYKAVGPLSAMALFTLFWATLGGMVDQPVFVVAEPMFMAYGNEFISNTVLTGPLLVGVVMMLLNIPLMRKFSKKSILVAIYTLFIACALGESLLYENMYAMLAFRMLGGITYGLGMATSIAIVSEAYRSDEKKGALYVGIANSVAMFGGALMTFVAGMLAANEWGNALKLLWIFIPLVVFIIVFVPNTPPDSVALEDGSGTVRTQGEGKALAGLIPMLTSLSLLSLGFFFALSQNSFMIEESGLSSLFGGNFVGVFGLVINCASATGALLSGIIINALGRKTLPLCYIMGTAGFALMAFVPSALPFLAGGLLIGASFGISFAYFQFACGKKMPAGLEADAIMVVFCVNSVFSFLSSYVVTGIMGALGTELRLDVAAVFLAAYAIGTVLSLVIQFASSARKRA